jgi:LacI family transcriptional regulator
MAGVSRGTVSRVVNHQPNVNPQVRARVEKIIEETGYRPVESHDDPLITIGVIIPYWPDVYFTRQTMEGIRHAQRLLHSHEVKILVRQLKTRSDEECIRACEELVLDGVQGIVFNSLDNYLLQTEIDSLMQRGIKVITYNSDLPGSNRLCHVGQDVLKSGRIAAGLMARSVRPHEQILLVTGDLEFRTHRVRINGFVERLKELGFSDNAYHLVECNEDEQLTYNAVRNALHTMPNLRGIYMGTESVRGCMRALRGTSLSPTVICNDLMPFARQQLRRGNIDFVIEQDFPSEVYEALLLLAQLLLYHRPIRRTLRYVNTSIVTSEAL